MCNYIMFIDSFSNNFDSVKKLKTKIITLKIIIIKKLNKQKQQMIASLKLKKTFYTNIVCYYTKRIFELIKR